MEKFNISIPIAKLLLKYCTKENIWAELYSALSLYTTWEIDFKNIRIDLFNTNSETIISAIDKIEKNKLLQLKSEVNVCIEYLINKLDLNIWDDLLLDDTRFFSDQRLFIEYLVNMWFDGKSMILLHPKGTEIYRNSITYFIKIITRNSIQFWMRLWVTEKRWMVEKYSDFDLFDDSLYMIVQKMLNSSNKTVYELFGLDSNDIINYLSNK